MDKKKKHFLTVFKSTNTHPSLFQKWRKIHFCTPKNCSNAFFYFKKNLKFHIFSHFSSLCDAPNVPDKKGATPITAAASNGHIDVVKLLITKTDNPNIPDKKGMTPITAAASNGHIDVVKLLMSKTDTPNAPDNVGDTPIMTAAYNGHMDVVKLLMSTTDTPK